MDAQNTNAAPRVTKDSKNKIRVEFDRTPLKERLKAKFLNFYFLSGVVIKIARFIFLLGIAYIVLYPFFTKITGSFMSPEDLVDATVRLIPRNFTLNTYKAIFLENHYLTAFLNTFTLSFTCAILQTFMCCLIAYGLAKYKFRGNKLIFLLVVFTMVVPHKTLYYAMYTGFQRFDIFGIVKFLSGGASVGIEGVDKVLAGINIFKEGGFLHDIAMFFAKTFKGNSVLGPMFNENAKQIVLVSKDNAINLLNSRVPFVLLSLTGLAFKNGLYIFMLRQFFRGIPDSIEESAYIDGSGDFRTFFQIILPMSVPMMITVFLFAFCWQWTDTFYTGKLFLATSGTWKATGSNSLYLLKDIATDVPNSLRLDYVGQALYNETIRNTSLLMIIFPLVILYTFLQRYLVEGIERSGLTAE